MLYNGGGNAREVKYGKDIFRQLHSGKFLAAFVVSVPCRSYLQEKGSKRKNRDCCFMLCHAGYSIRDDHRIRAIGRDGLFKAVNRFV